MATTLGRKNFLSLIFAERIRQVHCLNVEKRFFSFLKLSKFNPKMCLPVRIGPCCLQSHGESNRPRPCKNIQITCTFVRRMAGHSHWANIKFKKMHKDHERSRVFGKLSLEIITAVRENGADPANNSKLDAIVSRAKAAKMPKDSIESAIKSALRAGSEARTQMLFEVRGPGRCGILLNILSSNVLRSRSEIKAVLKKHGGVLCDGGSVSFMFKHKGVVTVEGITDNKVTENQVEEAAILSGAESFHFDTDDDEKPVIRFICDPLEVKSVAEALTTEHSLKTIAATQEYIATNLTDLSEDRMTQADKLLDYLSGHPDVMQIFDNIRHYPSSTFKLDET